MDFSLISNKISSKITGELNYSEDKREIIAYAIETLFLFISGGSLIILLGYVLNALMPTILAATFGGLLRKVSGGAHFDTPLKCMVVGAVTYSFLGLLSKDLVSNNFINNYVLILILSLSLLLVSLLAPVDSESKPIHSKSFRNKLKILSMIFVILSFLIIIATDNKLISFSAVLGLFYQSITLLPIFNNRR